MIDTKEVFIISGAIGGVIVIAGIAGGIYLFSRNRTKIPVKEDTSLQTPAYISDKGNTPLQTLVENKPQGGRRRKRTRRNKRK